MLMQFSCVSIYKIKQIRTLYIVDMVCLTGGFDVRNYVAVAFCVVWLIVNILLFVGAYMVFYTQTIDIFSCRWLSRW
jgi:hypothetical protein